MTFWVQRPAGTAAGMSTPKYMLFDCDDALIVGCAIVICVSEGVPVRAVPLPPLASAHIVLLTLNVLLFRYQLSPLTNTFAARFPP